MCGILFTTIKGINEADFRRALDIMKHRGPDAVGCITRDHNVLLGHNRLSILDLEPRSNQPFYSTDRRYIIVYNGEIYNYRELAAEYRIRLRTTSDTELLLELYAQLGERMLSRLIGMFAFVIYDTLTGEYFIARDRLGVKPLYIYETPSRELVVASEVAAILALIPPPSIDSFAVRQYRKMRGFFNGRTLYKGIGMFPAAHCRTLQRTRRYWQLPNGAQSPPCDEELKHLVTSAVNYRCVSDVPVGTYLSGGLDSSIITALATVTHTWAVGMPDNNEFEWARMVADALQRKHHEVVVASDEFLDAASLMVRKRREPLAVPNEVLLYLMTKEVKLKNTVVLSGEGADELFAGYDRIFRWAGNAKSWDLAEFASRYVYGSDDDLDVVEDALAPFVVRRSPLEIVSAFFQISHLHGLLRRLDNSTMLCSVEGRVPFVDHRLVERLAGVGLDYKMPGGVVKAPLKRVFGYLLPQPIVSRIKVGFPVDLSAIMPPAVPGRTPHDRWFNFCLAELGIAA